MKLDNNQLEKAINRVLGHTVKTHQAKDLGKYLEHSTKIRKYAFDIHLTFETYSFYLTNALKFAKFFYDVALTQEKLKQMYSIEDYEVLICPKDNHKTELIFFFSR